MTQREALTLALEALEYEPIGKTSGEKDLKDQAIITIKEALAQPEQRSVSEYLEPVAMKFKIYKPTVPDPMRQDINNALLPWVYDQDRSSGFDASMWVTPVATLPPQRTWVGLTSVDWNDFNAVKSNDPQYVAAWAEAKLKDKNT